MEHNDEVQNNNNSNNNSSNNNSGGYSPRDIEVRKEKYIDRATSVRSGAYTLAGFVIASFVIISVLGLQMLSSWWGEAEQNTGVAIPTMADVAKIDPKYVNERHNPLVMALYSAIPAPVVYQNGADGNKTVVVDVWDNTPKATAKVTGFYWTVSLVGIFTLSYFVVQVIDTRLLERSQKTAICINCNHPLEYHLKRDDWAKTGCYRRLPFRKDSDLMTKLFKKRDRCGCMVYQESPDTKPRKVVPLSYYYLGIAIFAGVMAALNLKL